MPVRKVTQIHINYVGLALLDLNLSISNNWTASCVVTFYLVAALWGRIYFQSRNHSVIMKEGREEIQIRNLLTYQQALSEVMGTLLEPDTLRMRKGGKTGT